MKRVISLMLALILIISCMPTQFAWATEEEPQTSVDENLTVEGTNAFGTLLSQELEEYQEEETTESGYTVVDLTVEGNTATVEYSSLEEATLVVALYTEDGQKLLTSAKTDVSPEETTATVTFEGDMPEYFMASAYLLDVYDFSPLSASYVTPMYTREMQELLASTVDDYDADRVLNLDESTDTNFAVYAEDTILLEPAEDTNTVASVDDENATYVIENADESVTGLQPGDVFAYPYADNEILIVKVATITVDGTTATITGAEVEMEDVFSHMKLEVSADAADVDIDDSTIDEGITFDGITQGGTQAYDLRRTQGETSVKNTLNYTADKEIKRAHDEVEVVISLKGTIGMELNIDLAYYIAMNRQFMKFETDIGMKLAVSLSGKVEIEIPLGDLSFMFYGISIGFEPAVSLEVEGEVEFSCFVGYEIGYIYDNVCGLLYRDTIPQVEFEAKVEASIFLGIDLKPKIDILKGVVAKAELKAPIGFELKAVPTGTLMGDSADEADNIHTCKACIDMTLNFKAEFSVKLEFLKSENLSFKSTVKAVEAEIGTFFWSIDQGEFGVGDCPYKKYRVTIQVKNDIGKVVPEATVRVLTNEGDQPEDIGTTNGNGIITVYLQEGDYTFSTVVAGKQLVTKATVNEACKVLIGPDSSDEANGLLGAVSPDAVTDYGSVVASGECGAQGDNVTWKLYSSGLLKISGNGDMKGYGSSGAPWYSYRKRIIRVIVEDSVTSIGNYAFYNCDSLTSVTISDSVTSIGKSAFYSCSSLTSVYITDVAAWCGIDFSDAASNPLYYANNLYLNGELVTDLVIPDSVTGIGDYAFYDCDSLTSVTIGDSVTSIGKSAFYSCSSLTSVTIPDSVTSIGNYAFYHCSSLTSVTIGDSVTSIGDSAFRYCGSLTSVTIPDSVTSIGDYAFSDCGSLTSVTIPDSVTSIGDYAFRNCDSLTSVTIPDSVTSIGVYAFYDCGSLTSVTIGDSVTSIGDSAFRYCGSLTSVTIPDSVTSIGKSAFYSCSSLTSVTIPDSVTSIGVYAFFDCGSLTSVTIGDSVTTIGDDAFYWCYSLTGIWVEENNPNYSSDSNGVLFNKDQTELIQYPCGLGGTYTVPDSVATIGDDAFDHCSSLTSVTIPDSVTSIGKSAFYSCSSLTSVTIGDSVTSIGDSAFRYCGSLTSVTIGDSVTSIGDYAFSDCGSLTSVTIPDSVTSIGDYAFRNCDSLTSVTIPDSVTSIGVYAFYDCGSLTSVTIGDSVTSIGDYAFYWCYCLTSVTIGDSVTTIGDSAFSSCDSLAGIVFEGNAPSFGNNYVFSHVIATAYYPAGNSTWTSDVMQDYGGTITWIAYDPAVGVPVTVDAVEIAAETVIAEEPALPEDVSGEAPFIGAVWGGEYDTEVMDTYTLKTATFSGLVAGEEYLLLSLVSLETEDPLAASNLLYVDQAAAGEDGSLVFQYIQREDTAVSYVMACGASNKNLSDATVTFPAMYADEEVQAVAPTVVYDGTTLTEGVDYTIVGTVDYTEAGTYTCYIRGIRNYTGLVECRYTVEEPEIEKFDFSGSTMTLGNELVLNFVYNKALLTGTDNYAKVTIAREDGDYTYEIPQSEWTAFNTALNQIPVKVFAKEMTDEVTVVICNAAGQEVSNPRTGSVVAYCNNLFEKSNVQKDKAMAVDMLNYGAAAQIQFNYREETLANAGLTDELKALATVVTDMQDTSVKGPGCAGNTLTLEDKILLNFVYQNATIDKAAYATVSYVDHYDQAVSYNIEAADFLTFNSSMMMVQINTLVVADCRTMVSVELFDADGNSLGVSKNSVESYTARSGQELFKAILAFGDSAYAKFH